jgi:hypothetical protein
MILLAGILAAYASPCEVTATYEVDGEGRASCLYDDLALAPADIVTLCAVRELGAQSAKRRRYPVEPADVLLIGAREACPNGMPAIEGRAGRRVCLSSDHELPDAAGLDATCTFVTDGELGYAWDVCPAGATFTTNCVDTAYCLFDVALPATGADAYCDYLDLGYFGYTFADVDHVCPPGMVRSDNGAGLDFCLADVSWFPPAAVDAYCQFLDEGYLGFSWDISGEPLPASCNP